MNVLVKDPQVASERSAQKKTFSHYFLLGGALFLFLFHFIIWPMVWHLIIFPHARPDKNQLRVESYSPTRAIGTSLFLDKPNTSLSAYAVWNVPKEGFYHIRLTCDDNGKILIDNQAIIILTGISPCNVGETTQWLTRGPHFLELRLNNILEKGWLKIEIAEPGQTDYTPLNPEELSYLELGNIETWINIVSWGKIFCFWSLELILILICLYMTLIKKTKKQFLNLPIWFWYPFILMSILKLWLVAGQHISAIREATYDDRLYINLANNIINFNWLGSYNNLTLLKGPFYPIWIAMSYFVHIPLFFSQHLLYIFSSVFFVIALRPILFKTWQLLAIFLIVVFNPMSFVDGPATRVVREGIYPALTILVIAFFSGLLLRRKSSVTQIILWTLGAGMALSCFWLTREEGIWIMPFVIFITLYSIFVLSKGKDDGWKTRIALFLFPFLILYASVNFISAINYYKYGVFNIVEINNPAFLNAYGALTRVKAPVWMPDVPVSTAQRQIIYSVSPSFSELKPILEENSKIWTSSGNRIPNELDEIKGGWFALAFRDAVAHVVWALPVYRFYDQTRGIHFYTASESEKADFVKNSSSTARLEGVSFYAYLNPVIDNNSLPVYKFTDIINKSSLFTISEAEKNSLADNPKRYVNQGIAFYAYSYPQADSLPLYHFYNPDKNENFYTISETNSILADLSAYKYRGISFYTCNNYQYLARGPYYQNGKTTMAYYQRLAEEINSACDEGKIACYGKRSSLMSPWNKNYNWPFLNSIYKITLYTVRLKDFNATPSVSGGTYDIIGKGNESSLRLFNSLTRSNVEKPENKIKVSILDGIGEIYEILTPAITIISILIFLFYLMKKRSFSNQIVIIGVGIIIAFFARIVGLSLIDISSFSALDLRYLSPLYPLLFLFISLNLVRVSDIIGSKQKNYDF